MPEPLLEVHDLKKYFAVGPKLGIVSEYLFFAEWELTIKRL